MITRVNARVPYSSRCAVEMIHVEAVSVVHAAIEFVAACWMRIETGFLANYRVIRLLRGAI